MITLTGLEHPRAINSVNEDYVAASVMWPMIGFIYFASVGWFSTVHEFPDAYGSYLG